MNLDPKEALKKLEDERKRLYDLLSVAEAAEKARQDPEHTKPGETRQDAAAVPSVPEIKEGIGKVEESIKQWKEIDTQSQAELAVKLERQEANAAVEAEKRKDDAKIAEQQQADLRVKLEEQNKADQAAKSQEHHADKSPGNKEVPASTASQGLKDPNEVLEASKTIGATLAEITSAVGFVAQLAAGSPAMGPIVTNPPPISGHEDPSPLNSIERSAREKEEENKKAGEDLWKLKETSASSQSPPPPSELHTIGSANFVQPQTAVIDEKGAKEAMALTIKQQEERKTLVEIIDKFKAQRLEEIAALDPKEQEKLTAEVKKQEKSMLDTMDKRHDQERQLQLEHSWQR
jgi:hypothetical protein